MKIITTKFKIIIGIIIFILIITSGYSASKGKKSGNNSNITKVEVGEKVYNGKFLTPVENFITVSSKYGTRIHQISRTKKKAYRNRFGRK